MPECQEVKEFTNRDIVSVALRIMGFVWLIRVAKSLIMELQFIWVSREWLQFIYPTYQIRLITACIIEFCLAFVLIFLAERIAKLIIRFPNAIRRADDTDWSLTWFEAAVAVTGVAILTLGIVNGYSYIMNAFRVGELPQAPSILFGSIFTDTHPWPTVIHVGTWLILGACLAIFSQSLCGMLHGARKTSEADG